MEKRSFIVAEVLCFLLGWLGAHRYYTGYIGLGIAQTLTLGGCGIWSFIDFVSISIGKYADVNGNELEDYDKKIGISVLCFVLAPGLFFTFGSKNALNNTATDKGNLSTSTERKVKFDDAVCTISANQYSCFGNLRETDKSKIRKIQRELEKGNNVNTKKKVQFNDTVCTVTANQYSCNGNLSETEKLQIRKIQATLK